MLFEWKVFPKKGVPQNNKLIIDCKWYKQPKITNVLLQPSVLQYCICISHVHPQFANSTE